MEIFIVRSAYILEPRPPIAKQSKVWIQEQDARERFCQVFHRHDCNGVMS